MVLSEVEILKSSRLARAVVAAEKLDENEVFLNPPRSPVGWVKAQVKSAHPPVLSRRRFGSGRQRTPRSARRSGFCRSGLDAERVGRS